MAARIIILNGVGSVGKSSVARALQHIAVDPYLHVSMDVFLDMVPEALSGHPDGIIFETVGDAAEPSVVIRSGPVVQRALLGMRHAVAAMAGQGNNLIVDEVILDRATADHYRRILSGFDVYLIALVAPLPVLEDRERRRGDRLIGLARWQYDRVHVGVTYDLEVDTSVASPMACAQRIKAEFGL